MNDHEDRDARPREISHATNSQNRDVALRELRLTFWFDATIVPTGG